MCDFIQMHLQEPDFFLVHEWQVCEETVLLFWDSYVKFLRGDLQGKVVPERTTSCITWRVPRRVSSSVSASRLCSDALSWAKRLRNPEDQDDHKKGTLSDQPQLRHVTHTALLGSWVLQLIEDMTSLRTDFEMHAKWQGSIEEPAAKDFCCEGGLHYWIERSAWNPLGRKQVPRALGESSRSCRQTSNNQPLFTSWKSLGDSLPELYCIDLAEAYVTQESVSSRILLKRKGMIHDSPMDNRMRNLRRKAE